MSMEFLPRLFDSFSRERIPCEKQKNKRHHISIGVACVRFQALSVLSALGRAVVHTISVGWYGSDGITGRCSG